MFNYKSKIDLPKTTFLFIFIISMIFISFYVLKPFLIGFLWAVIIVIITWPIFLKIKNWFKGNRIFSVFMMILFILLFFVFSFFLIGYFLVIYFLPLINKLSIRNFEFLRLYHISDIPLVRDKLLITYHKLLSISSKSMIRYIRLYFGNTTEFFFMQTGYFFKFLLHSFFMLIFSIFLYWNGEKIINLLRNFAFRLGSYPGYSIILLSGKVIRSVSLGIIITSLVQGLLGSLGLAISGISCYFFLIFPIILFSLLQLGSLPILIPSVIWLFFLNCPLRAIILLIWSAMICILDNVLRTILIKLDANFPTIFLLSGIIGGLLSMGLIGLFIGPVVLVIIHRLVLSWMNRSSFPSHKYNIMINHNIKN